MTHRKWCSAVGRAQQSFQGAQSPWSGPRVNKAVTRGSRKGRPPPWPLPRKRASEVADAVETHRAPLGKLGPRK